MHKLKRRTNTKPILKGKVKYYPNQLLTMSTLILLLMPINHYCWNSVYYNSQSRSSTNNPLFVVSPHRLKQDKKHVLFLDKVNNDRRRSISKENKRVSCIVSGTNNNDNDDDDDGIFYNDFEDDIIDEYSKDERSDSSTVLSNIVQQLKLKEMDKSWRIQSNLMDGNWNVRGCSLDKYPSAALSPIKDAPPIRITHLCCNNNNEYGTNCDEILVGRSDGSIFWLSLGTAYLTSFTATTSLQFETEHNQTSGENLVLSKETTLVDSNTLLEDEEDDIPPSSTSYGRPFKILHQFPTTKESLQPISSLLFRDETMMLYTASNTILQKWKLEPASSSSDNENRPWKEILVQEYPSSTIHKSTIHTLKLVTNSELLLSISNDCFVIWNHKNGKKENAQDATIVHPVEIDDNATPLSIQSADVYSEYDLLVLGMHNGYIYVYDLLQVLRNSSGDAIAISKPLYKFRAYDDTVSITSLQCTSFPKNDGDVTASPSSCFTKAILLQTGSSIGILKQYQIFIQETSNSPQLQHWPRMPNQRISYKNNGSAAHVFKSHHIGSITCCTSSIQDDILISSGTDGRIIIHSIITGESLYSMEGFSSPSSTTTATATAIAVSDEDDTISSIVYSSKDGMLITNGMMNYVCMHDFDIKEWVEDSDSVSDWLDFQVDDGS